MSDQSTVRFAGTNVPEGKVLSFQILPNGVSTPTIGENRGLVVGSVTRTGVGVYAIVLNDKYVATSGVFTQLQLATAADSQVQVTSFTQSTTKTLTVTILTAGSAADIAANAGNIIHFLLVMRDTTAQ